MKFKTRFALKDREGEEKVVRKFSLLPRSFGEDKERVWLETVDIVYRIKKIDVGGSCEWSSYTWKWVPIRFATDKDMQELPFEVHNSDLYDIMDQKVKSPIFWLCLDSLALAAVFFDIKSGITLFLTIKLFQIFSYLTFLGGSSRSDG